MKHISSRDNPRFKHLRALNDDSRYRRQSGTTLIDGDHLLSAALDAGWKLGCVMFREDVADSPQTQRVRLRLAVEAPACELLVLAPPLFNALSPVISPSGYLAEIEVPPSPAVCDEDHDVLALAGVQDAGNLGTLLRTAAAAGVHQVWLDRQTTHAWSPKALRAGMGAQFQISIRESCDLKQLLVNRRQAIHVTSLADGARPLYALSLLQPGVWVFGAEGQGVPPDLLALATQHVMIPMPGQIESLNVAAAAAVCLFEQLRQRQFS
jgi:TrmH family RNA methyltransferase